MYGAIQADVVIVAFNLPFDLSRLAVEYRVARGAGGRGWSFVVFRYRSGNVGIIRSPLRATVLPDRKAARENKEMKFTALLHHLTVDLLRTKSTSGPLNCQSETDGPPVDEAWDGSPGAAGDETIRRVR